LDMGPFLLIQSNPIQSKMAGIKANSKIKAYVSLPIVMLISRGYSAVVSSL